MKRVVSGVTRTVYLVGPVAVKVPAHGWRRSSCVGFLRGWLANRSEWKQSKTRADVNPVLYTFLYLVNVYDRADEVGTWEPEEMFDLCGFTETDREDGEVRYDELKGSSWGRFRWDDGDRWLLIDYDRAWQEPRGAVGGLYYGRQERMAREWAAQ